MANQKDVRIRLKSFTDCQRQMARLYGEARRGDITMTELNTYSQHINRASNIIATEKELDIFAELMEIEERLASLQERRG